VTQRTWIAYAALLDAIALAPIGPNADMIIDMTKHWKTAALAIAAVIAAHGAARADTDLSGFQGRWQAVEMESTDTEASKGIALEHLGARIDIDGDEIRVRGSALVDTGGDSIRFIPSAVDVVFFESDRPAVLAPMDAKSKLLGGLISAPEQVDPLAGETLRWARAAAGQIVFYRFMIDDAGAYSLGKYELERAGDGLTLTFTAYAQARSPVTVRATLKRIGD